MKRRNDKTTNVVGKERYMLCRVVHMIMILMLIMETGCVKRVPVDVYPIRRPSDQVKQRDKVTAVLREETDLKGVSGADSLSIQWRTVEVTGRLVKWDERQVSIQVIDYRPGEDAVFIIPLEQVEQIDQWPGFKPGSILTAIGFLAVVIGLTFLLVWAISKPGA